MMNTNTRLRFQPLEGLRRLRRIHAPLTLSVLLTALFTLFFAIGIFADSRVIGGEPVWLKPTKFGVSITLYTLTLTWILGFIRAEKAWKKRALAVLGWVVVTAFAVEWLAILTQVLRGTRSHFNYATPFDAAMFSMMGAAIMILWVANFVIAGLLLFQRFASPVLAWSLRLAMIVTIVGMGLGFLMTSPTAQQRAAWAVGEPVTLVGAHSVGVADGGAGLPVTGWSTQGGDLRIGHFLGLHALQVLPLLGWMIARRRRLSLQRQLVLVGTAATSYLALVGLLTWQALRAQPLTQPDAVTLGAWGTLALVTVLMVLLTLRWREAGAQPSSRLLGS